MKPRQRRFLAATLDSSEGTIDLILLIATFFIVQNVWQITMVEAQTRFVDTRAFEFIKAVKPISKIEDPPIQEAGILEIFILHNAVRFEKGNVSDTAITVFQAPVQHETTEQAVFEATKKTLTHALKQTDYKAEDVLVRLYFERNAKVLYTVGVYEALMQAGFVDFRWSLLDTK